MKMKGLSHLNLVVSDVERSAEFYQRVFGMERQWREGDFVFLACGDSDVALVKGKPLIHRRFHFGFRVESREAVDAWRERMVANQAAVTHGPNDYGDYYTFSCRDPDGYAIEIYFEEQPRGRAGDVGESDR
jgi:catechol 2,3-dioxygenase-like lactoylglutathione lyase family enzyme